MRQDGVLSGRIAERGSAAGDGRVLRVPQAPSGRLQRRPRGNDLDARGSLRSPRRRQLISTAQLAEIGLSGELDQIGDQGQRINRRASAASTPSTLPRSAGFRDDQGGGAGLRPPSLPNHWSAAEVLQVAEPPLLRTCHQADGQRAATAATGDSPLRRAACDTSGRDGILCTSAARTSSTWRRSPGRRSSRRILIAADSERIVNRRQLQELVDGSPGRRGMRRARSLLAADPIRVHGRPKRRCASSADLPRCRSRSSTVASRASRWTTTGGAAARRRGRRLALPRRARARERRPRPRSASRGRRLADRPLQPRPARGRPG